jgi:glucose/arabinose dehydrogenase
MKFISVVAATLVVTTANSTTSAFTIDGTKGNKMNARVVANIDTPWAMTFLPSGQLLVTSKLGKLWLVEPDGKKQEVRGLPKIEVGGQGGLGDVVLHPDYANNSLVFLSMVQSPNGGRTSGAVVIRAKLNTDGRPKISQLKTLWRQQPTTSGRGHFSHRIAFGPKGSDQEGKMFITSGDRQKQSPAQSWKQALGKIVRLNIDGSVPADNPYQDKGNLAKSFWSTGHRNLLGIAFDGDNRLWAHEMGPRHGDELNLIVAGENYGWPIVSNGDQYSGVEIPDHDTRPEFAAPKAYWVPSIAPSGLVIYSGDVFPQWQGDAFIGGLRSRALIRVDLDGENAAEAERFEWGKRIREVEQGPGGNLWVLEDRADGRLLELTPSG